MYYRKAKGRVFMRRNNTNYLGLIAVGAGVLIILSLVLPKSFWWFALAAVLICGGVWLLRCC